MRVPIVELKSQYEALRGEIDGAIQQVLDASWYVLGDLLAAMGEGAGYFTSRDAFAALAAGHASFAGMSYESLGLKGQPVADAERFAAARELAGVA